jgi:hypothetical protein
MLKPKKNKLSLKDKIKVAKAAIKTIVKAPTKASKESVRQLNSDKAAINDEFPGAFKKKKGGLVKKQDGGVPVWEAKSKSVKNTEWQKAKVPSSPFSVVPPSDSISKPKPKPNWVSPPASKDTKKKGGATKDKNWIQKAVNPAHKGYCTPMTKPTCTPKRKALAMTFKKMAKNR